MLTFAERSKTIQQGTPVRAAAPSRANYEQHPEMSSIHQVQHASGDKTTPQQTSTESGQNFSEIPAFSSTASAPPVGGLVPRVIFHKEQSVEKPGEEEQTVDGGTPAPTTPAPQAACDCVPSSVQITNVSPYRSGDLYGHNFDVEVALTYSAAASGPGTDAQLFWFEKTDRPPAWQGLTANVWNDMYALFPTSGTFDGWNNRTKPCPGSETATIHDPPGANVNMPARTLEFDIYVRGQQISHNARAKQVLEPDGSGGIRTQTFEILPSALGPLAGP